MGGRHEVRRLVTTALPALLLALTLTLLPSMGSSLVPTAALVAATPSATVVHLLGDEVIAAPPGPAIEVRARNLLPDDVRVSLLLAVATGLLALAVGGAAGRRVPLARAVVRVAPTSGRSPPRHLLDR